MDFANRQRAQYVGSELERSEFQTSSETGVKQCDYETRVTGDEPRGTKGRRKKKGDFPPIFPLRANLHRERDVWQRGRLLTVS